MPAYLAAILAVLGLTTLTRHFIGYTDSHDDEFGATAPTGAKDQAATTFSGSADCLYIIKIISLLSKNGFKFPEKSSREYVGKLRVDDMVLMALYCLTESLETTLGFGAPYRGGDLKAGSQQFGALHEQLDAVLPHGEWKGTATQVYADRVVALQDNIQKMIELDGLLAYHAEDHAKRVNDMRLGVGFMKAFIGIGLSIGAEDGNVRYLMESHDAKALIFDGASITYGVLLAFTFKIAHKHGNRVRNICHDYERLGNKLADLNKLGLASAVAANVIEGQNFEAISARISEASDVAGVPPIAALAGLATDGMMATKRVGALASSALSPFGMSAQSRPAVAQRSAMSGFGIKPSGVPLVTEAGEAEDDHTHAIRADEVGGAQSAGVLTAGWAPLDTLVTVGQIRESENS